MLADTLTHELVPLHRGQTVHDRQDKAALSPHRFRQADTKGKSIKGGQFPRLLSRAKKTGYITRFTVAKRIIGEEECSR